MTPGMAMLLAAALIGAGVLLGYAISWLLIGHEPLLARNCNCRRGR